MAENTIRMLTNKLITMPTQLTPLEQYVVNAIHEYDSKGEDHRWLNEDDYDNVAKHIAEDLEQLIGAAREAVREMERDGRLGLFPAYYNLSEQLKKFEV